MTNIRVVARIQRNEIRVKARLGNIILNAGSGGNVQIKNSDGSFDVVASSSPYVLEDTNIRVFVNGVLNQSAVSPSMVNRNINITPAP
ncbi:MAG: hypothetical protein U0T32_11895 [Chitinophagales bacterium]